MASTNGTQTNGEGKLNLWGEFYNIIDGQISKTKETRHGINPATKEELPPVPVSTKEDVDRAVKAARKAFKKWSKVPMEERRQAVLRFADAIMALAADFAKLLTTENGKPVRDHGPKMFLRW